MDKSKLFPDAIEWVNKKSTETINVNFEGYETPKSFKNSATQEEVIPDMLFINKMGHKHFVEIALKTDNERNLATRWKLLSLMASMKKGKLHLLAPKGHKMFAQKVVKKNDIAAEIYSL